MPENQYLALFFIIITPIVIFLIYRDCKETEKRLSEYHDTFNVRSIRKVIYGDRIYVQCPNGQFMRKDLWETAEIYGCAEAHWFVCLPKDEIEWLPKTIEYREEDDS